ncbi:MAG: hypothetical protein WC735_04960 [Candidatus Paceibacterota bacterium]|jgi:hypothetical protein
MKKRVQITLDENVFEKTKEELNLSALINAFLKQRYKINGNSIHTNSEKVCIKNESIHTEKDTIEDDFKNVFN